MKKIFILLLLFVPVLFSCTKNTVEDTQPKMMVTVEVTSEYQSQLNVPSAIADNFQGSYKKTFPATQTNIAVYLHSDKPCTKTIVIYVNGNEVARRSGNCIDKDYSLTYDLHNY